MKTENLVRDLESFFANEGSFGLSVSFMDDVIDLDYTNELNIDVVNETIILGRREIRINLQNISSYITHHNSDGDIDYIKIFITDTMVYELTNIDLLPG